MTLAPTKMPCRGVFSAFFRCDTSTLAEEEEGLGGGGEGVVVTGVVITGVVVCGDWFRW